MASTTAAVAIAGTAAQKAPNQTILRLACVFRLIRQSPGYAMYWQRR